LPGAPARATPPTGSCCQSFRTRGGTPPSPQGMPCHQVPRLPPGFHWHGVLKLLCAHFQSGEDEAFTARNYLPDLMYSGPSLRRLSARASPHCLRRRCGAEDSYRRPPSPPSPCHATPLMIPGRMAYGATLATGPACTRPCQFLFLLKFFSGLPVDDLSYAPPPANPNPDPIPSRSQYLYCSKDYGNQPAGRWS
jgi:hypothetical protein